MEFHAERFGKEWCDAWNARDLERVLAHYTDDVRFVSPTAARVTGNAVVEGKEALRAYWTTALASIGALLFSFDRALWDPEARELTVVYDRELDGRRDRACEFFRFTEDGQVSAGEAMYGATDVG